MANIIDHLWAEDGRRCIVTMWDGNARNHWFDNTEDAQLFAERKDDEGYDTYFAMGLFSDDRRKRDNVQSIHGFWLDIDVGSEKCKYETKGEAAKAVGAFIKKHNLPKPWVVDSGGGLHVYWSTRKHELELWRLKAKALSAMCKADGLDVDTAPMVNAVGVLRVPGTHNHKKKYGEPRLVKQKMAGDVESPFLEHIRHVDNSKFEAPERDYPEMEYDYIKILNQCPTMDYVQNYQEEIPEPLWYQALGIAAYCKDPEHSATLMSQDHPDFDEGAALEKMHRRKDEAGPTRCDTFATLCDQCEGCPLRGKIKSPIVLGKTVPEPATPAVVKGVERPSKIGRYNINKDGVFYNNTEKEKIEHIILDELYLDRLGRGQLSSLATVTWNTPQGKWLTADLPMTALGEAREMRAFLNDNLIRYTHGKEVLIMKYIAESANEMQSDAAPDNIVSQFGWEEDMSGFHIGTRRVSADGIEEARLDKSVTTQLKKVMSTKGDLESWAQTTEIYNKEEYYPHGFAVLCALAAPVLKMINVQGCVVSLAGPSGTGKTTALHHAMSVFGERKSLLLSGQPTITAQTEMLRVANNIAVGMDDLTAQRIQILKDMVYMAANGQSRERATKDGTLRERHTWATALLVSTNSPLLGMGNEIQDAERRRIIEIDVGEQNRITREDGQMVNDTVLEHHGVAGEHFIGLVMRNYNRVRELAMKYKDEYWNEDGIPDDHRFGAWMCGAAMAAGVLAYRKGIIQFDPEPVVRYALSQLKHAAGQALTPVGKIDELLNEYLNDNHHNINVKSGGKFQRDHDIRGPIAALIVPSYQRMYIPVGKFKEYVLKHGGSIVDLRTWEKENVLDKHTQLLKSTTVGGRQIRCMAIRWYNDIDTDKE
jgi:hypothetical protein